MNNYILLLSLGLSLFLISCEQPKPSKSPKSEQGLVKVTILYPNEEGKTFDMDYYANKHMPMLKELFGDTMKKLEIDTGIAGRTPDDPIPFLAIGYLYFESLSDYEKAFGPNAKTILEDIPNYTNIQPIVQISEVVE